jgi:hypothetical protein
LEVFGSVKKKKRPRYGQIHAVCGNARRALEGLKGATPSANYHRKVLYNKGFLYIDGTLPQCLP